MFLDAIGSMDVRLWERCQAAIPANQHHFPRSHECSVIEKISSVLIGNLEPILEVEDEEDAFEECEAHVQQIQISIAVQTTNNFTVNIICNSLIGYKENADGHCGRHGR